MKADPSAFDYFRKKYNTKRRWPKLLLAAVVGVLVAIVFHQNKQSSLVEREARCADIQQAAKIVKLNYLLGEGERRFFVLLAYLSRKSKHLLQDS